MSRKSVRSSHPDAAQRDKKLKAEPVCDIVCGSKPRKRRNRMGAEVPSAGIMAGNFTELKEAPKHKFKMLMQCPVGEIKSNLPHVIPIVKL